MMSITTLPRMPATGNAGVSPAGREAECVRCGYNAPRHHPACPDRAQGEANMGLETPAEVLGVSQF
jgi:hypothetical protein